jgi:predicted phage gp36 major capsid-like protein
MKAIRLEIEHATTGERKACEYVQTVAEHERRRGRAKALVLRWPTLGGQALFCIASGWELEREAWRLTADARARARQLAKAEGLELPEPSGYPPRSLRARARTAEPQPQPVDPRQARLPFT